ncbi:NAD(P)-dependent oxidoreductase [Chitinophaga polysaccharea]|uniref:NAD-dependent epimerase/dehydratase family protein n=1 Tax=Chitinophaga polysaccharea TaxID=1293035 RepID=UPI001455C2FE|nr:NAD(P)-dependent oxidoreductase [Chitinophaga polysaccharea]NLR61786.1 NAD(P)-dependent oxidoreductase [Chitinophaga polysaccharea]
MKILVTGSAGHLGEALVRTLRQQSTEIIGLDIKDSAFTTHVGSITDRSFVKDCMKGVSTVFHAATLHKPHVATHTMQQFIDTNITGTLHLLQEAVAAGVQSFVFTSTTSVFGDALVPPVGEPAAWITEEVRPQPKNIYGVTKAAAEELCQLFYRNHGLSTIVLRTSRFFPEEDDNKGMREAFADENLKANEYLFRRVELEDAVSAHLLAAEKAPSIGWAVYIISATSPFSIADLQELRRNAPAVVQRIAPAYAGVYSLRGWKMHDSIDRVYVNEKAKKELGWMPKYDFNYVVARLDAGGILRSPLAQLTGSKGYHTESFTEGPYPTN